MFRIIILFISIHFGLLPLSISNAQYSTGDFPAIGTNFVMAKSKVFPERKIGIRDLGGNIWDLSIFNPTDFDTIRLIEPKKTRYGKRFPESDVVMVYSPVKMEYISIDSGKIYLSGLIGDFMENKLPVLLSFTDKLLYNNPYKKLNEEYGDTSETFFLSPYYHHPGTDSIKADIFYSRTGRIDASGELITPFGKFKADREVIFVQKRVRGYKYSVFGWTPAPEYSIDKHYTFYRWYTKGIKLPLAEAYLNDNDLIDYISYQYDSPMKLYFTGSDVSCKGGSNGKVDLTVVGGIPDYSYQWTNSSLSQDLDSVKAGTYRVVVTDNRGRSLSSYYTVSEPIIELQAKVNIENISCRGNKDGRAKLSIRGGKAPYDFVWSNDSVNETISNLSPGIIKYMVLDAGGCRIVDSIEIVQPEKKLGCDFELKPVTCYNGSDGKAEVIPNGGTPPYRFEWFDGDTCRVKINLRSGQHQVTVYDKNNCDISSTIIIKQAESAIKVVKEIKPVSCYGGSDGMAELNVSGGKAPYQYFWSDSTTNKSLKGYASGEYIVEILDKNDCKISESIYIPQPLSSLQIAYTKKDVNCYSLTNGEIKVNVTGGTAPYDYSWSNGANKPEIKKLGKGLYIVKVNDKNNCLVSENIEILSPEKALFVDFEKKDVNCKNGNTGSIKLAVEGGTPDYTFLWSNKSINKDLDALKSGKYEVIVSDKNQCQVNKEIEIVEPESMLELAVEKIDISCNGEKSGSIYLSVKGGKPGYDYEWSNGENSPNLIGIGVGKYSASVIDNLNCRQSKIIEITEPEKLQLKSEIISPDADKNNGSIRIEVSGGIKPYYILWDDGLSTNEHKMLTVGKHEVQIKDAKDCLLEEVFELKAK
jgi:hypothetical protein